MLIQNQQQQPSAAAQVQIRQSLALKSLDQTTSQIIGSSQPLSPTHSSFTSAARQQQQIDLQKIKDGGRQKDLKGTPNIVGLTQIEYSIDEKMSINITNQIQQEDMQKNYLSQIYEENAMDYPFQTLSEQFSPNDSFTKIEITIKLPYWMSLEQFEIQIQQMELFNKYLKLLKVEIPYNNQSSNLLHLRSAFLDKDKKILEVNSCGVGNKFTLTFLYNHAKKASLKKMPPKSDQTLQKEKLFSKTQNVSEKIKNEILPLLNGSDEDIDELDDEVAMISNKKGNDYNSNDIISTDDIKIEITSQKKESLQKQQKQQMSKVQTSLLNTQPIQNDQDIDGRNFNTLPRNYSDPLAKQQLNNQSSYNNLDVSASLLDQQLMSKDIQDSDIMAKISPADQLIYFEQEIFNGSNDKKTEILQLLHKCIENIKITGFNLNQIPAITNMTHFINSSFLLKKNPLLQTQGLELDFMTGVLMISTKRPIQAVEVFRKIQAYYLKQIEIAPTQKLFTKCAILELLTAESMGQANQLNDKINSIKRMCELAQGNKVLPQTFASQIYKSEDPYSIMIQILPALLKFTVKCMTNRREIVKMAALKLMEFILETKGCSLDHAMVFILKAILRSFPNSQVPRQQQESFQIETYSNSVLDYFQCTQEQSSSEQITAHKKIKEPASGFNSALKNAYNHALDTYISVLSSISSHILHQLFYEVIIPTLTTNDKNVSVDTKLFSIKIAEKIITICQGDLILSKQALEFFINSVTIKSNIDQQLLHSLKNLWTISIRTKVFSNYSQKGLKTLIDWLVEKMSIIAQNAQTENMKNTLQMSSETNSDISKLETTEEETQQLLQIFDIISMISAGRKKNEEEANSLIQIKQEYCLELYLLINPLLFWLDFSVEREERFNLFKSVYQTIKDVLENLPPKRVDLDILQIMIPILQRTTEFLKNNSPSLSMLKFLDIVLRDIKSGNYCSINPDLQYFFLEMLNNFVGYISYCLYEDVFTVFDKLLSMCADVINENVLNKCIVAMVDKYTMKSKTHKNSLTQFMKGLMEVKVRASGGKNVLLETEDMLDMDDDQISVHSKNNYFEILCNFCFFKNEDPFMQSIIPLKKTDFRSPVDNHDLYIDKLQFFVDSLQLLSEIHVTLYTTMITHPLFKSTLLGLLTKTETSLRLKCHEILEIVTNYYVQYCTSKTVYELAIGVPNGGSTNNKKNTEVMEVEYINHERLYISQIVIQCVRNSLQRKNDSYLQFNSLILLDFLFQNLLPVPTYQNEQLRDKVSKNNGSQEVDQVIDLETIEIDEATPEFEVTSKQYSYLRLTLIMKLWGYVQAALNSAWSNIRSICYGLICSMLKIDIRDYQSSVVSTNKNYLHELKQIVIPMLTTLLSSKESESKAGGLNILGSFCGLSYDFSKVKISKNLDFFKKNSSFVSLQIWQLVFELQDDWDITIKEASVVLVQLCAPREAVKWMEKEKREKENARFTSMLNKYGLGGTGGDQSSRLSSSRMGDHMYLHSIASNEELPTNDNKNILSFLSVKEDLPLNFDSSANKQPDIFDQIGNTVVTLEPTQKDLQMQQLIDTYTKDHPKSDVFDFFVDGYTDDQIQEIISIFRNDFKPPKNLWIEKNQIFSQPDYYQEIFSSAIDQFNQQQMQAQQQQQQQLQQQVSGGGKRDVQEDELVRKFEEEKKEYQIFERHYEEDKQEEKKVEEPAPSKVVIDAEPIKYLDNVPTSPVTEPPPPQLQLTIIEDKKTEQLVQQQPKPSKKLVKEKKSTDELIEEYERKISKTKQLLEEEKKKSKPVANIYETQQSTQNNLEMNVKSTPDFKVKKETLSKLHQQEEPPQTKSQEKKKANDLSKIYGGNIEFAKNTDNVKLIKQINNCFNDNSYNNFNIGPVVMTTNVNQKKQKLNKSYENIMAANKSHKVHQQLQENPPKNIPTKKNLSTSPRRGSSSGKKSGSSKSGYNNKKKYLDAAAQQQNIKNPKALYNMRDLNFFIKTIEKDLSDKFTKLNMKDFNSMPTTPTSILKKVEDQMKALQNKNDIKAQMSNTCPNMAQMLRQLDTNSTTHTQQQQHQKNVLQISQQNMNGALSDISSTPSSSQNQNLILAQSQNSLSNYSIGNALDKFTFSKTQKIDFNQAFNYQLPQRDGLTHRDLEKSPIYEDKYASQKQKNQQQKGGQSKRSRGSQDKYLMGNQTSGSSSYSKLNKSANNISSSNNVGIKKKDSLSKSMINNFVKNQNNNISPNNKKLVQQMLKQQLGAIGQSQATTLLQQTPHTQHYLNNQYSTQSNQSNILYDYIQNSDKASKKQSYQTNVKTPVKTSAQRMGIKGNYSEILEISPSSNEKDAYNQRYFVKNFI